MDPEVERLWRAYCNARANVGAYADHMPEDLPAVMDEATVHGMELCEYLARAAEQAGQTVQQMVADPAFRERLRAIGDDVYCDGFDDDALTRSLYFLFGRVSS